jgi:hypothetical protein
MSGTIHVVKTPEEFYEAVQVAQGGDRIELAPGDYGDIAMRNMSFDENIVITSQNPDDQASFNTVKLNEVSNVTFDNLFFDFTPDEETVGWDTALRADNSSNISVINSRFEGGPAVAGVSNESEPGTQGDQGIQGEPIGRGMAFNWSNNITIENNDISQFEAGIRLNDVTGVEINSNEIHHVRAVPVGGADVSNLSMEYNYFHDANPWNFGGLGDHGDFVHFWTSGPDAPVSENHYYANNIFDQGDGEAILGIYLEDNYEVGFRNVVVENNLIYNGNAQALRMENVDGLTIRDNTLLQSSGDEKDAPMVGLTHGNTNVLIEGNIFGGVRGPDLENAASNNITINDNLVVQIHDPQGENYYGDLFVTSAASVFDIQAVPGDMADGIGASFTQFDWSPDSLTPQFQVHSDASSGQAAIFDASLTVGPLGLVSESDAEFRWTFGDGYTATGQIVKHDFAAPGYHDVTLTVIAKDGTTAQAQFTAGIAGDDLVQFDAQAGIFETLAYGEETALDGAGLTLRKTADGHALKLGGDGTQASVAASELTRFFGTDSFEMSMSLKADSASSWGEVARIHTSFTASVDKNGNFVLQLFPDDGSRPTVVSKGVVINDGNAHEVTVRFDGKAGFAEVMIDGKLVGSQSVSGSLSGGARSLDFGNPWGDQNFDGELSDFSLRAESRDFPIYDGETVPVSSTEITASEPDTVVDSSEPAAPEPTEPDNTIPTPGNDPVVTEPEEKSSLPEPLLNGGYQLDVASVAASDTVKLHDDAHLVETGEGPALSFDGAKDYASLGRLTEFEASQKIAFSIDFVSNNLDGSTERLVWNHAKLGLTLEGDGLRVHAGNNDDPFWKGFEVDGLGLNDGSLHTATVLVDAETDRLQVVVDDVLVLDEQGTDFDFVGAGGNEWGWSLGTAWNRWFEGEVHEFQVSDDFDFLETSVTTDDAILA